MVEHGKGPEPDQGAAESGENIPQEKRTPRGLLWWIASTGVGALAAGLVFLFRWKRRSVPAPTMAPYAEPQVPDEEIPDMTPMGEVIYLEPEEIRHPDGRIEHPAVSREAKDMRLSIILGLLLVASCIAVIHYYSIWRFLTAQQTPEQLARKAPYAPPPLTREVPPEPRLGPLKLREPELIEPVPYGAEAWERLHSYGRTDQEGFVHVPIETAMQWLAGKLPARKQDLDRPVKDNGLLDGGEPNSGRLYRGLPSWMRSSEGPADVERPTGEEPLDVELIPNKEPSDVELIPNKEPSDVELIPSEESSDVELIPSEEPADVQLIP